MQTGPQNLTPATWDTISAAPPQHGRGAAFGSACLWGQVTAPYLGAAPSNPPRPGADNTKAAFGWEGTPAPPSGCWAPNGCVGGTETPRTQGTESSWGPSQLWGATGGSRHKPPQLGPSSSPLGEAGGAHPGPQRDTGGHPSKAQADTQHPREHGWVLGKGGRYTDGYQPPGGHGGGGTTRHPASPQGGDTGSGRPRGKIPEGAPGPAEEKSPGGVSDGPGGGPHLPAPPAAPR